MPPERLGPYRIAGTLGRGGMGAVYRAVNEETGEAAAVKILSSGLADDPDFRQRFEAEIETLRKLRHPNIVRLFGFGEEDGQLFYAMELVEGSTLQQELQNGRRFDWQEVGRIGLDMCRALRHAHDRGIIHRDIKPANLLLAEAEQGADWVHVKLSDFGIARLYGNTRLTAAGNVLGTLDYMAPEQADGRATGPRSDLYSLGGVLYTLLARRPPFRAKSLPEMLDLQRTGIAEPVRRYNPDVPAEFETIIIRLLEKDPKKRFATATVLAHRIEAMLPPLPIVEKGEKSGGGETAAADDFDLQATVARPGVPAAAQLPETREATRIASSPPVAVEPSAAAEDLPETMKTAAIEKLAVPEAETPATIAGPAGPSDNEVSLGTAKTTGHFVRVEEEDLDRYELDEPAPSALISLQTWALAAALVLLGSTAWYLLQDPSADDLYDRVTSVTADGTISSYRQAERDIRKFIELYSDDSRSDQLQEYLKEIQLGELEREFTLRAKGLVDTGRLLPIERDYLEAIKYVDLDPERGTAKLQALIDLYGNRGDESGPTGQCLALARKRLERLREQADPTDANRLALILDRLDRADELAESEPEHARRMREAVVELYEGKPWASEAVKRAQEALDAAPDS